MVTADDCLHDEFAVAGRLQLFDSSFAHIHLFSADRYTDSHAPNRYTDTSPADTYPSFCDSHTDINKRQYDIHARDFREL